MNDETELKLLYERMYQDMVEKNTEDLNEILSDEFVLVHMTGMRQSKKVYLQSIADGTLNYKSNVTEHICVEVNGHQAKVIGQSRVSASVFGSAWHTWNLQQDLLAEKKNGSWKFTKSTASTYGG